MIKECAYFGPPIQLLLGQETYFKSACFGHVMILVLNLDDMGLCAEYIFLYLLYFAGII